MNRFVNYMHVNSIDRIMSTALRLAILNKSVFIITKINHSIIQTNDKRDTKYLDYMIQLNEFLCKGY